MFAFCLGRSQNGKLHFARKCSKPSTSFPLEKHIQKAALRSGLLCACRLFCCLAHSSLRFVFSALLYFCPCLSSSLLAFFLPAPNSLALLRSGYIFAPVSKVLLWYFYLSLFLLAHCLLLRLIFFCCPFFCFLHFCFLLPLLNLFLSFVSSLLIYPDLFVRCPLLRQALNLCTLHMLL